MRRTTVLAVLAVPLLAATASAAPPKPVKVCQLLTDPANDTGIQQAPVPIDAPSLDIVSADIASSAKTLVGAIRVRALRSDTMTTTGAQYMLYFTVGEAEWRFSARRRADTADSFDIRPPGATADTAIGGSFDATTNAIYFTVPRKAVPELKNLKVTALRVTAAVNPPGTAFDSATGSKPYVDLQPSCLAA